MGDDDKTVQTDPKLMTLKEKVKTQNLWGVVLFPTFK
jgi:hypothetical protein